MARQMITVDGNEAAARVAYQTNEVDRDLSDHAGLADGRMGR